MSTGADCVNILVDGKWFYLIQCWPYGEWPVYDAHGPFDDYEELYMHRRRNYANPGGTQVVTPDSPDYEDWRKRLEYEL